MKRLPALSNSSQLKILNLEHSSGLTELPNLTAFPLLKELNLIGCTNLPRDLPVKLRQQFPTCNVITDETHESL